MSATMSATMPATMPDLTAVKARQRAAWSTGNYAIVGTTLQIVGESLAEAMDLRAGMRVLDVAAGNGNATLAAARRFCDVTSTDYVPDLLSFGRMRAAAEGLDIAFREADAEALPFADDAFDAVLSTFGVMFTADQERAARELVRVTRPGGRIGLANWTPEGFVGQMFRLIGAYVRPAPGVRSPAQWGTHARLAELFGARAESIRATPREFVFRYRSPGHFVEVFRTFYGPVHKAFAALDPARQETFTRELLALLDHGNRAHDGTLVLPSEYLEVVIDVR
jgi:ubiquinone/menaquinone biosynthesis C-methylase UbiE